MPVDLDIFDSANQKYDNGTSGLTANNAQAAIDELAGGAIPEAPNDASRSYFREGTTPDWTKLLKGYGEVTQTTAVASAGETLAVDDGNVIVSNLTGAYTLTALNAGLTMMSATWVLQHNTQNVVFPASFRYAGGTAPDTTVGNTLILGLFTVNGGTTWIVTEVNEYTL